jgi:hypothetical protein
MKKNYDGGNMDWLGMNNGPREWAVAYHATAFDNLKNIGQAGFIVGGGQAYESHLNINPSSNR